MKTILVKQILLLTNWTGLIKRIEKRINYPGGLIGFLESKPCGYVMLVQKTNSESFGNNGSDKIKD